MLELRARKCVDLARFRRWEAAGHRRAATAGERVSGGDGEVDAAAFFQLGGDGPLLVTGKKLGAALEEAGQAFGVEDGDAAFTAGVDPPAGHDEDGGDGNGAAVQGGELPGEPSGMALGLLQAVAVGAHRGGKDELLAIENHLVGLLPVRGAAARFAAGLGFDGEDPGGGGDDVVDVPRLLAGFADLEVVEDADGVRGELVEDLADDLFAQEAETVIGIAQQESGRPVEQDRACEEAGRQNGGRGPLAKAGNGPEQGRDHEAGEELDGEALHQLGRAILQGPAGGAGHLIEGAP